VRARTTHLDDRKAGAPLTQTFNRHLLTILQSDGKNKEVQNRYDALVEKGPAGPDVNFSGNEANPLFHNTGKGFEEIGTALGASRLEDGRGYVLADLDQDGTLDVVLHNFYRNPVLALLNRSGEGRGWIRLGLRGTKSNRFGIGARVTAAGQVLELAAGHGYLSGNAPWLHFGLGAARETDVRVRWPSGQVDEYRALPGNRVWTLVEGDPKAATAEIPKPVKVALPEPVPPPAEPDPRALVAGLRTPEGGAVDPGPASLVVVFGLDCRVCTDELKRADEIEAAAAKLGLRVLWVTRGPDPRRDAAELRSVGSRVVPLVPPAPLAGVGVPCVYLVTPARAEKYVGRFAVDAALEDAAGAR